MHTLSDIPDTSYELPLSEADQAALRPALLRDLGAMPFTPGAPISRSLWVIFVGEWGAWTHAVLPVDDSLGMPDDENLTGLCDLIGSLLRPPRCHDDEKAMIVLRRPGSPEISEADAHIFAQVCQAVARRETAPWAFHVAGPAGTREVTEHKARQDLRRHPAGLPGSAEELPKDGGSSGRDVFVGEELRAYPEGRLAESTSMIPARRRRSSTSRVLAASAFIAKMWRGDAAVTRRPGWSNTRRMPGSSLPEM